MIGGSSGGTGSRGGSRAPRIQRAGSSTALLALLGIACGGPLLMLPGGRLAGEPVAEPVADWSFVTDAFVDLETRPGDPYSVEVNYLLREGRLYIDPAEGRRWLEHIREDPRVRLRFGDRVYGALAVRVEDPEELEGFDPERFVYRLDPRRLETVAP